MIFRLLTPRLVRPPAEAWRVSGRWRVTRAEHLARNPTCAACGGRSHLHVHHVVPVASDPSRIHDPGNLLTLCTSYAAGVNCHLFFGHGGSWQHYNKHARRDAAEFLAHRTMCAV